MIDTDKYEGHTEGPWEWFEGEGHKDLQSNMAFLMFGEVGKSQYPKPADAALITDAPLLLAEVKRLRVIEERNRRMGNVLTSRDEEIELWMDNFEVTSQDVGDLEQQYEDLLRQKTEEMIRESEGLDWKSIAYMTARLKVEMGYTCASSIEGYGDDE
jgi:hypothetical protein